MHKVTELKIPFIKRPFFYIQGSELFDVRVFLERVHPIFRCWTIREWFWNISYSQLIKPISNWFEYKAGVAMSKRVHDDHVCSSNGRVVPYAQWYGKKPPRIIW
jgi:hypothetical protein